MINITKQDWAEIYYAIKFKRDRSPVVDCDKHLDKILKKIGPDGTRAIKTGISKRDDWWTVILLYPDYCANNFGQDTYYTWVEADSLTRAVDKARSKCRNSNKDPDMKSGDLFVISVLKGKHKDSVGRWNKLQQGK